MASIESFEEIEAWKSARELTNLVYDLTDKGLFTKDFGLRDQIRRAVVSVLSNITEGFESQNDKTFVRYLFIAKGSAGEVRAQLYIALDRKYVDRTEFSECKEKANQTSRLIAAFIKYLRQS